MAMTADGKVSGPRERTESNESIPKSQSMSEFGSQHDHARLLRIRSTMDAVICGRHTIEAGAIDMGPGPSKYINMRKKNGLSPFNKRIVVSASGQVDPACHIFQKTFSPILIATTRLGLSSCVLQFKSLPWVEVRAFGASEIDLNELTAWLKEQWDVNRLILEGGGTLNDAFFRHSLVDEIYLTICPLIFGGNTNSTVSDGEGFQNLKDATRFKCIEKKCINGEMFLRFLTLNRNDLLNANSAR